MARPSRRDAMVGAGVGLMSLGCPAQFRGAFAQAARKASGAVPAFITNYCPPVVAFEKGFFKDEGLDFSISSSGGGARLREIIASGQMDFGLGDITHPLQMSNRGRPSKALLAVDDRATYVNIVVRSDLFDAGVDTPEKLANHKKPDGSKPVMAVSTLGAGTHTYAHYLFERLGMADKLAWVAGGVTQTMLGGLQTKRFDAITAAPSWQFEALDRGIGKVVFDVIDPHAWDRAFGGRMPATVCYALQSTIDADPAKVQAYVNGVYRGLKHIREASMDDLWALLGEKYFTGVSPDVALKELRYYQSLFNYSGMTSKESYDNGRPVWFNNLTEIKPIAFNDAFDLSFIANAARRYGA